MDSISNLFGRLKNLALPDIEIRESFVRAAGIVCGVKISLDKTSYRNGIIFLKIKPIEKNHILLNLDKVKAEMEKDKLKHVFKNIA